MVRYGLTIENEGIIIEKAKNKNDGVYSFRWVKYRVKNNNVTHFAANGIILERCYGFNVVIGKYKFNSDAVVALKSIK